MTNKSPPATTCVADDLALALKIVGPAIASKSTLPVLRMVLFDAREDGLWLTATNLEWVIRRRVPARLDGPPWQMCAPFDYFKKSWLPNLKTAAQRQATLVLKPDYRINTLQVGKANVKGESGEEFPTFPEPPADLPVIHLPNQNDEADTVIRSTVEAVSKDDRKGLDCQFWEIQDDKFMTFASDGFYFLANSTSAPAGAEYSFRLGYGPSKALLKVLDLVAADTLPLQSLPIEHDSHYDHRLWFCWPSTQFYVTSRNGRGLPDFQRLLTETPIHYTVHRPTLKKALKPVLAFAKHCTDTHLRLWAGFDTLVVKIVEPEVGDASNIIDVQDMSGDGFCAVPIKQLEQVLDSLDGDTVQIGQSPEFITFQTSSSPAIAMIMAAQVEGWNKPATVETAATSPE